MTPEETCRKLRPIMGKKISRLWRAYLVEDAAGKREIGQILDILYEQTFKESYYQSEKSTLLPPAAEAAKGEYPIGQVTYSEKALYPFGLREKDWIKHVLIVGASGSGKTNLCFQILRNFLNQGKPFLVFDWKRNYRDIINEKIGKKVQVFTAGRDVAPFRFNPLIPPPGTAAKTWLKKLIEIIAHATFVGDGVMYLLQKGLDETYRKFGMYDETSLDAYPTLKDLMATMEKMGAKGRAAGWMSSTLRALGALTFGESGKVLDSEKQSSMKQLLENNVILELDALANSDKTFLVESLLLWIHHYRLSSPKGQSRRVRPRPYLRRSPPHHRQSKK